MNVNKKQTYDSSESSSDSDSDNELPPQTDSENYPSLSLVDDGHTVLHIPNYQAREVDYDEEPGETDDVKKTKVPPADKGKSVMKTDAVTSDTDKQKRNVKRKKKKTLYICLANCKYDSVKRAARRFGFKEVGEEEDWNLYWTDFSVSLERVMDMKRYQKINHFPGMSELCRKDLLARNLNRMLKLFPKDYNFFPRSWCLPADFGDFLAYTRQKKNKTYILKPESGCQGKGIWLTKSPKDIKPHEHMLCQQYLSKPFLIDGFKFDLRVYVVVTACDPLRIFIFQEGLGRFATCKYTPPSSSNVHNVFMHLTNYAINKNSNDFNRDDEAGSKRRITTINRWLADNGYDVDKAWRDVDDIVIKTLISAHTVLKHNYRTCFPNHIRGSACFEVLGFDIVFDKKLRPLVLEVNHSPSFTTDAPIDREIKDILLYDTLNLVNFGATDRRRCIEEDRRKVKERLFAKQDKKELKEDQDRATQKWLEEQTVYEDSHLGNFRRIYPAEGTEKYDKFFHSSGSLYQETAAFKARSECARQQREEISRKQEKLESMVRKKKDGTASGLLRPESPPGASNKPRKRTGDMSATFGHKSSIRSTASITDNTPGDSMRPTEILDADESERVTLLLQRDTLVRGLGIVEHCHRLLKSVQSMDSGSEPMLMMSMAPGRPQAAAATATGGAAGDRPNGLTVDAMALSNAVADAHYYLATMNNRISTLNAQHNLPSGAGTDSRQQQQLQQQSPAGPSQRTGFQQGQGQGRSETVSWRSTTGQHGMLGGSAQPLAGNDRSNGAQHRTRYTNRNGSDSNVHTLNENGRAPALMKMMLASTPPSQYDGISGSSTSGVVSGYPSYQSTAGSTMSLLLPHIHKVHHQQSQQPTPYFGLSVISAPAPFAQRSTGPSTTGSEHPSSVGVAGTACRVGSGGGFRGQHRSIPLKTVARDS